MHFPRAGALSFLISRQSRNVSRFRRTAISASLRRGIVDIGSRSRGFSDSAPSPEADSHDEDLQRSRTDTYRPIGNRATTPRSVQRPRRRLKGENEPKRIYIVGVGKTATFVAHCLASSPSRPPITFILRNNRDIKAWVAAAQTLKLTTHGLTEKRQGFDSEVVWDEYRGFTEAKAKANANATHQTSEPTSAGYVDASLKNDNDTADWQDDGEYFTPQTDQNDNEGGIIRHLVAAGRPQHTVAELRPLIHRLDKHSTILFLQTGMGIIDEVNKHLFPNPTRRPRYIVGIFNHALWNDEGPFSAQYIGRGNITLGLLPTTGPAGPARPLAAGTPAAGPNSTSTPNPNPNPTPNPKPLERFIKFTPSSRYLLRTFTGTPTLVAIGLDPPNMLQTQLETLAISSVIQPLSALFDCRNGLLLNSTHISRLLRLLLAEISVVVRALPEMRDLPNIQTRFDPNRLENKVVNACHLSAHQTSQTLLDVRAGWETELGYLNGYIFRRGEEVGVHCVTNYAVWQMVMAATWLKRSQMGEMVPVRR